MSSKAGLAANRPFPVDPNSAPKVTVGVKEIPFGVEIYGTRGIGRDSRLDFAFATRAKRAADLARAEKDAEEKAKHDKQLKQELEEHNARIERSMSRGLEQVRPTARTLQSIFGLTLD